MKFVRNVTQWFASVEWRHGFVQMFIAVDQLLNVFLCNPFSKNTWADETISSRCGRDGHRHPYKFWKRVIDACFHPFQGPNHCVNAYEKEKTRYQLPPEMRSTPPDADHQ